MSMEVHKRILVVDDNKDVADVTVSLLRMLGHEALAVYDGLSALQIMDEYSPDMVLLDIGMPHMDGYVVAEKIRTELGLQNVLLVAVTGYSQPDHVERVRNTGFDAHIIKPVGSDEFKKLIAGDFIHLRRSSS